MILTRQKIIAAVRSGDILIEPFDQRHVSTNAYDWHLGDVIRVCSDPVLDAAAVTRFTEQEIRPEGMVLVPGELYLGITHERTCSEAYAQLINGDRSVGALGVWVHVSAPLGHVGHAIRWTLEIRVARAVRVYPRMAFGKIVFVAPHGDSVSYQQVGRKYRSSSGIDVSQLYDEVERGAR
ncbi:dCTP deaminase domain-containing protein [Amycolatopsis sp. PS_44_ISF1]|uniref:dCTP deaminase n=1 Tax=Amycolatopsis sp. PS_44_ISF1 TaxID=2974917 RepID=UPI0028DEEBFB|nr:deoxycytidine triphosphate deaminase [Amycolatopsis sp. PS_44_ISF1]MDT8911804.1 deoxycytidine triphosphate deaminase [Amycolatopsis sp. PS_44_ISF1]MDT8916371.1 deoxycytidine triphosphate deaminase [Amycolatopsis sp. PS_44_ISF1]MDT8916379.1 deoxycytidine triphosphate deaminase [Amycolatopsis sp. PS_44_ISF1]